VAAIAAAQVEAPPQPARPTLVNVLGSLAWSVFDYINRILQGPPMVPAGSGLKVGRSDLSIDCGDGYTAQADWYFPEDGEADKLIYFQHGFLATSGFYNLTAAELAERNNAIVVAPSITSDFFACDACNLTGDPMHAGVGMLFTGDREALTTSARAAAQRAGVEFTGLPTQFVIAGHSAGGQLAAGTAGYFYALAPTSEKSNLVGVLLLDTSATGGGLGRALDRLPSTLPVLHISANPGPLNTYGNANDELEAKRPGQFNGVRLVGGSHSDAFRSSTLFGLTQMIVSLGTGASSPENVEAVQVLAQAGSPTCTRARSTTRTRPAPASTVRSAT
jgi:pimeloyl-ACP methyl ester carboxylesterase